MADVTIYHNPSCTTSRKVLAAIREAGVEPRVIEYLKAPPSRAELKSLLGRMGMTPRALLRRRGTPYDALGLDDPTQSDEALVDAMLAHPVLIERPIVVTERGVRLCRPVEKLAEILP
jgi:arsenate reductase (glutaredoxin)